MKAATLTIPHDGRAGVTTIYPIGDVHIGSSACDEKGFARYVKRIADDPTGIVIGLGDYLDAITPRDKRWEPGVWPAWMLTAKAERDPVKAMEDRFLDLIAPIRDRFVMLLSGNHEQAVQQRFGHDPYFRLAEVMGDADSAWAPGYSGWLQIRWTRPTGGTATLNVWCHHGIGGGGRTVGAKANGLEAAGLVHEAGLVLSGHVHRLVTFPLHTEYLDREGTVRVRRVPCMVNGCWRHSEANGWEARKGFAPSLPAHGRVVVRPWLVGGFDNTESIEMIS